MPRVLMALLKNSGFAHAQSYARTRLSGRWAFRSLGSSHNHLVLYRASQMIKRSHVGSKLQMRGSSDLTTSTIREEGHFPQLPEARTAHHLMVRAGEKRRTIQLSSAFPGIGRLEVNLGAFAQAGMKAMIELKPNNGPDSVEITENLGEWFVRVVRNGKATISTLEMESYARAFEEGQRLGLGLGKENRSE